MRCKACNKILNNVELMCDDENGEVDLCFKCLSIAFNEYEYLSDKKYVFDEEDNDYEDFDK